MAIYDSQNIPIPFRNAMSGPAGDYSDSYQKIVQQYRDDLASAKVLSDKQNGVPPLTPQPGLIHKSRNDIVRIDPVTGQSALVYRAPEPPARPLAAPKAQNPYVDPREMEMMRSARDTLKLAQSRYTKLAAVDTTPNDVLMNAQLDVKDAEDALSGFLPQQSAIPPLNPQPALAVPTTATASAPAYTPAPMMTPGEIPPPGSIIMGRRNTLAAPPSTTQDAPRKRFVYQDGKLIPAQ